MFPCSSVTSPFPNQKSVAIFRAVLNSLSFGFQVEFSLTSKLSFPSPANPVLSEPPKTDLTSVDVLPLVRAAAEGLPSVQRSLIELFQAVFKPQTTEQILSELSWTEFPESSGSRTASRTLFCRSLRGPAPASLQSECQDSQSRSVRLSDHEQRRQDRKRSEKLRARNLKSNLKPAMKKYNKIVKRRRKENLEQLYALLEHAAPERPDDGPCEGTPSSLETADSTPHSLPEFQDSEQSVLGEENVLRLIKD